MQNILTWDSGTDLLQFLSENNHLLSVSTISFLRKNKNEWILSIWCNLLNLSLFSLLIHHMIAYYIYFFGWWVHHSAAVGILPNWFLLSQREKQELGKRELYCSENLFLRLLNLKCYIKLSSGQRIIKQTGFS